jgi:hypothetical protein
MSVKDCASELRNAKARLKDMLVKAISNSDLYEVEVSIARVERRYPHLTEDDILQAQEREERIEKEVKHRETRRSTQKSFWKLGYQIRVHVKPNSMKKSSPNSIAAQTEDGIWCQIVGKVQVDKHLIERNVEQFSHAGAIPLGYTELGRELGHTGDTSMDEAILGGTFEHDSLSDDPLAAIVKQLRKHPAVREIILPIVTEADFKSALKCLPEKTALSFSGRGGSSLQGLCRRLRRWASGHPVLNSCRNDDITTSYRILSRAMEEDNLCNAREYTGGRALQQAANYPTAGGGPKPIATHSFIQENCKIGQEQ